MVRQRLVVAALVVAVLGVSALAAETGGVASGGGAASLPSEEMLAKMPVREVTVFKDGHALLMHTGKMKTDAAGNVLLDDLPSPVLGTFWAFSNDPHVTLSAVTAGERKVSTSHTALSYGDLLRANIGAKVQLRAGNNEDFEGTVTKVLDNTPEHHEHDDGEEAQAPALPPGGGEFVLLQTGTGMKVLNVSSIEQLLFEGNDYKTKVAAQEQRNVMTLQLKWPDGKSADTADVGMLYLQKGIRWIPSYKVTIDGKGHADFALQGTLINEIADLNDVTANLVVGVPTFAFKDQKDPIGLQNGVAQLSSFFPNAPGQANTGAMLRNSIMSQARMAEQAPRDESAGDALPEMGGSGKSEDLFVFTVKHVTLKKGERMVLPIAQFSVPYQDVYTLNVPFTPPPEVWRNFATEQQAQIARLFHSPKVIHTLRIQNTSAFPITTGPALLMEEGKVLAQGMTEYTPVSGSLDLPVTAAVDVGVKKKDREVKRTPNAVRWQGADYARIDLEGAITLTNHKSGPVVLEVTRNVLGSVDSADNDGKYEMLNLFEDDSFLPSAGVEEQPTWWSWYNWPSWWTHFNGVARVTWNTTVQPGKEVDLKYQWHYFWN